MDKKKNYMKIPQQPLSQRILKYSLTTLIIIGSLWSAAGLEITLERILDAPRQIGILVGAMFPLDLSQEAFDRIIPKVFESLFIAWAGTVIGAIFSFPVSFLAAQNVAVGIVSRTTKQILNATTLTTKYLKGEKEIKIPKKRRIGNGKNLQLIGASGNNLKHVNLLQH